MAGSQMYHHTAALNRIQFIVLLPVIREQVVWSAAALALPFPSFTSGLWQLSTALARGNGADQCLTANQI